MSGNLRGGGRSICIPILHRYQPFIMYCIIKHLTTQLYCIRQMMDLWSCRLNTVRMNMTENQLDLHKENKSLLHQTSHFHSDELKSARKMNEILIEQVVSSWTLCNILFHSVQAAVSLMTPSVYSFIAYSSYDGPTTGVYLQHRWSGEEWFLLVQWCSNEMQLTKFEISQQLMLWFKWIKM